MQKNNSALAKYASAALATAQATMQGSPDKATKGQQDPVELHDEMLEEAGLPSVTWRQRFNSVESAALDEAAKLAADPHSRQVRRALRRRIAKQESHNAAEARRKRRGRNR